MGAGFAAFNADGTTYQIGQTYRNLFLVESGTATLSSAGSYSYSSFTRTGMTSPVIAVQSTSATMAYCSMSGSTGQFLIQSAAPTTGTVKYYIFDVIQNLAHSYGLAVWNESGQLVFDSGQKPMRVVDMMPKGSVHSATYTAGRKYACVHTTFGYKEDTMAGTKTVSGTILNNEVLTTGAVSVESIPASPVVLIVLQMSLLVLDVTGY